MLRRQWRKRRENVFFFVRKRREHLVLTEEAIHVLWTDAPTVKNLKRTFKGRDEFLEHNSHTHTYTHVHAYAHTYMKLKFITDEKH